MTGAEMLVAEIDKLTAPVETLEMLKSHSMAEWLASVSDAPPELEAVAPPVMTKVPPVGHV